MPKIPDYVAEPGNEGGVPQSRAATGSDFAGEGPQAFGQALQTSAAVLHEKATQDDVTNVRVAMAKARAEWDVNFRDRSLAAAPGDKSFAPKFGQDLTDYLGKARDIAQTREGQHTFDILAADLTGHFSEKAGLFEIQSAGVKARLDWDVSQRSYATSVVTDPTSYSKVLSQAMAELRDPNGQYGRLDQNTKTALETKMRDTLAQSYVNGLIDNGAPELARKQLMDGRLDDQLDPKDKQRLVHAADAGITAKRVAIEHAAAMEAREQKKVIDGVNDVLMGKFTQGQLTTGDVRASGLPVFGEGSQNQWIGMLKQQAKEWAEKPIKTVPSVMVDAFERIGLPVGDPRKITSLSEINQLYVQQKVSWADLTHLQTAYKDAQTEQGQKLNAVKDAFLAGVKTQLDKSTMNSIDQGGGERVYAFRRYVDDQVAQARAKNEMDAYELFNPASPKYLGKSVAQFQTAAQRRAADLASRIDNSLGKNGGGVRPTLDEIFKKRP